MKLVHHLFQSKLVRGSFIIFIAGNFASLGNFLYNLAMGRMLDSAAYGELEAVLSLSSLAVVPLSVLSVFIVKIVSSYWGQKKYGEARSFLTVYRRRLLVVGLTGSIFLLIFSSLLTRFLNLSSVWSIIFLSLLFLLSGLTTVNNSGLQGALSFGYLAINGVVGTGLKLLVSLFLVFFNFQLFGALFGPVFGGLITFLLSIIELKNIFKGVEPTKKDGSSLIFKETFLPVLFGSLALTILSTMDVILARHFFTRAVSGEFAVIAVIGKIVFYAVGPVISVMFPLISSRASNGTAYILPLLGTLAISFGLGSLIVFSFFMFPQLILGILFAGKYLSVAPYLGPYAFYMIIFSADAILTYFLLSISYYRPMLVLFIISLLQSGLIFLFHSSLSQLIWVNIFVSFIYLLVVSGFVIKKESHAS